MKKENAGYKYSRPFYNEFSRFSSQDNDPRLPSSVGSVQDMKTSGPWVDP